MCAYGEAVQHCLYVGEYVRRSLTVTPENDKKILLTKGRFLTGDDPIDIDYTTMVNIFLELGHKLMSTAWTDNTNPNITIDKNVIIESFKKHAFSSELKEESVGDQVAEIIFKKLVEQAGLSGTIPNQQQEQPPQAMPKPKTDEKTNRKYIT
ncbi:MAG: hypothetical protein FWC33_04960 [Candidatus Bathyarchaeota archaeon]|nr:hypothetical protein [Candidatus Termiticorpusculum sp.]